MAVSIKHFRLGYSCEGLFNFFLFCVVLCSGFLYQDGKDKGDGEDLLWFWFLAFLLLRYMYGVVDRLVNFFTFDVFFCFV